jgi:diguanylate cyclase (GGDEF)-like protein
MRPSWREAVLRIPPWQVVAVAAITSMTASAALLCVLMLLFGLPFGERFPTYMAMALIIPLCVSVPVSGIIVMLLREVDTARRALQDLAWRDELTGLSTRRRFTELARQLLAQAPADVPLAVALADVDDFKRINDRYGHATGDAVLAAVGTAITQSLRADDVSARWGGEEFAVLLPRSSALHAEPVLQRVQQAVRDLRVAVPGGEIRCAVSIGLAHRRPGAPFDALIGRADQAMYRAKVSGKDTLVTDGGP